MPSPFDAVRKALRVERKFTPQDPTVNWEYVNHLVYTANTVPYGSDPRTGDANSAVFACLRALSYASIEAPLKVFQKDASGEPEPAPDNPIQALFDEPHPELDILEICWWLAWARHADGNAYLQKVRAVNELTGPVVELWPVSPSVMRPKTEQGSSNFIDWYERDRYDGKPADRIPVENVIHFKLGVDPHDPRKGISPLKRLVREINGDTIATEFTEALLSNYGIPGLVVTLPSETSLSPKQQDDLKASIEERFTRANRGRVGVLSGGATMDQFGFSPEQLNMKVLHDVPETRIAAVMGVDPLVARLGVGLEQTSNYASARQVRENFTELTIIPLWMMDQSKWNRKLKPDFTDDRNTIIAYDLTEVRSLQEDADAKWKRVTEAWRAGMLTREMALRELGMDADLDPAEVLLVPTGTTYVEVGKALTDPAVEAQRQADAQAARLAAQRPPGGPPAAAGGGKAIDDPAAYADVLQQIVDIAAVDFEKDLQKLADNQQKRITKALLVNGTH